MPHLTTDSDYYTSAYLVYLGEVKTEAATATAEDLLGTVPVGSTIPTELLDAPTPLAGELVYQTIIDTNTAATQDLALGTDKATAVKTTASEVLKAAIASQQVMHSIHTPLLSSYTLGVHSKILQTATMLAPMMAQKAPMTKAYSLSPSVYNILKYIKPGG